MWWRRNASALVRPCHADARSASLRENRPSRDLRVLPVSPSDPGLPTPRRGGLRTPAKMAMPSPKDHPLAPPGVLCPDDYVIPRLASGPVFADAQSASLRENHFSCHPRAFLRKAILPWMALPAEGRAPHAHNVAIGPAPTLAPFGHRLVVNLSGGNEMSRR